MCFVWISEQTAIISLYNINWLDFITETECVYCAVRTGCLIISKHLQPSVTLQPAAWNTLQAVHNTLSHFPDPSGSLNWQITDAGQATRSRTFATVLLKVLRWTLTAQPLPKQSHCIHSMDISPLQPSGHSLTFINSTFCPHSVYKCESENRQWLFPYTTLTDWFL